jgi:hypothetical protein
LKEIEVGGDVLTLPSDIFDNGVRKGTIIDSGTTLAYLPDLVYEALVPKVHDIHSFTHLHLRFSFGFLFIFVLIVILVMHSDYESAARVEITYC